MLNVGLGNQTAPPFIYWPWQKYGAMVDPSYCRLMSVRQRDGPHSKAAPEEFLPELCWVTAKRRILRDPEDERKRSRDNAQRKRKVPLASGSLFLRVYAAQHTSIERLQLGDMLAI
jgi:hypothetical protein